MLFDESPTAAPAYPMRDPCKYCGGKNGRLETRGNQDCVYCLTCEKHAYNAPRVETGLKVRSLSTVHEMITTSQRARILQRANTHCELCGKHEPGGVGMHVGHLLSVKDGMAQGLTERELNTDENLAAMCAECNVGLSSTSVSLRLILAIVKTRAKWAAQKTGETP